MAKTISYKQNHDESIPCIELIDTNKDTVSTNDYKISLNTIMITMWSGDPQVLISNPYGPPKCNMLVVFH